VRIRNEELGMRNYCRVRNHAPLDEKAYDSEALRIPLTVGCYILTALLVKKADQW